MTEDRTAEERARFAANLDTHGAELARWPEEPRARASALLAADPAARALLAEARRLAEALNAWEAPRASLALRTRILDARPQIPVAQAAEQSGPLPGRRLAIGPKRRASPSAPASATPVPPGHGRFRGVWQPVATLLAATVFGITVGLSTALPIPFVAAAEPLFAEEAAEIALGLVYSEIMP